MSFLILLDACGWRQQTSTHCGTFFPPWFLACFVQVDFKCLNVDAALQTTESIETYPHMKRRKGSDFALFRIDFLSLDFQIHFFHFSRMSILILLDACGGNRHPPTMNFSLVFALLK